MSPQLPSFLRRRLRLSETRKSLLAGDPEAALEGLSDSCLVGDSEAEALRERVLDALCRCASRRVDEGRFGESQRLLELVAPHDPRLARSWRERLEDEAEGSQICHVSGVRRAAESGIIGAMQGLLGRMREERGASEDGDGASAAGGARAHPGSNSALRARAPVTPRGPHSFLLAVDDIGEFLVATGEEVTLGHARAEAADLPLLADLDDQQLRLVRSESFHAGPSWRIEPTRSQPLTIAGELIEAGGASLLDGDVVQVSPNVAFVFRRPEAASASAILEFLHGVECRGASRVLLFAPGRAGRVRLGCREGLHLVARRARDEVQLWLDEGQLVVESCGQLRVEGAEAAIQPASEAGPGGLRVAPPVLSKLDFTVGEGGAQGPPFGFTVRALPAASDAGGLQ